MSKLQPVFDITRSPLSFPVGSLINSSPTELMLAIVAGQYRLLRGEQVVSLSLRHMSI